MDILKLTKKLSNFLLLEFIFLGISIAVISFIYIFLLKPSNGWEGLGVLYVLFITITVCIIILSVLSLVNLIRAVVIKHNVNNYLKQNIPIEPHLLSKFKNWFITITIVNIIFILPSVLLIVSQVIDTYHSIPTKREQLADEESDKIKKAEYRENARKGEPERIKRTLLDFKSSAESTQEAFVGYGVTPNTGSCLILAEGSLFNARTGFKPKLIKDPDWRNHSIVNTVNSLGYVYVSQRLASYDNPLFNNMSDARCFSDENHFAYQLPSYLEDPYPTFYCVDDIHVGVQKGSKQIKGPNCEDFDPSYISPVIRPEPDMKGY